VQLLNGPSHTEPVTTFYCLIRDFPNLEDQVPVFRSRRKRVVKIYPRTLGSLYATSYYSQRYSVLLYEIEFRFRGFRLTQLCFNSCLLCYSNYQLHVSVVNFQCIYRKLQYLFQSMTRFHFHNLATETLHILQS
jgi:hypothetical protein